MPRFMLNVPVNGSKKLLWANLWFDKENTAFSNRMSGIKGFLPLYTVPKITWISALKLSMSWLEPDATVNTYVCIWLRNQAFYHCICSNRERLGFLCRNSDYTWDSVKAAPTKRGSLMAECHEIFQPKLLAEFDPSWSTYSYCELAQKY